MIHCVVLNYSPSERYNNANTFQVGVIHSKYKSDLFSYLRPIIEELKMLQTRPLRVLLNGKLIADANVTMMHALGDGVQCSELMSFAGHMSSFGCRLCLTEAQRRPDLIERKGGLYFPCKDKPLRSYGSLIHEEKRNHYVANGYYGIKKPSIFRGLYAFQDVAFHSIDEMHLYTNIAKYMIEMISPRYHEAYQYVGNKDIYPFALTNQAMDAMKDAVNDSRNLIPSYAFKGSFNGFDFRNSKSLYRSSDYIDFLQYNLILYAPLFEDKEVGDAISCHVRGVSLSLQYSISPKDLRDIDMNFNAFFRVINKFISDKKISLSVYKINMHQLSHITYIIKQNSTLRGTSVRSMERSIGNLKRVLKARISVGENLNNILQRQGLMNHVKNCNLMSFDGPQKQVAANKESSFWYHPSMTERTRSIMPQLWCPFDDEVQLVENDDSIVRGLVTGKDLVKALKACKKRLFSLTGTSTLTVGLSPAHNIKPAGKAWKDDRVYTCT